MAQLLPQIPEGLQNRRRMGVGGGDCRGIKYLLLGCLWVSELKLRWAIPPDPELRWGQECPPMEGETTPLV